jgi:hypothetical protein
MIAETAADAPHLVAIFGIAMTVETAGMEDHADPMVAQEASRASAEIGMVTAQVGIASHRAMNRRPSHPG